MKKFKYLTIAVAAFAICCFALAGCSGGGSNNTNAPADNTNTANTAATTNTTNTAADEVSVSGTYTAIYVEDEYGDSMDPAGDQVVFSTSSTGTMTYEGDEFIFTYKLDGNTITWKDISGDTFEGEVDGNQVVGVYTMSISGDETKYGYVFEQ